MPLALITGGARGLGKEFAEILLETKAVSQVSLLDLLPEPLEATVVELNSRFGSGTAIGICTDVTNSKQLQNAFERSTEFGGGRLDIVINNAGIATPGLEKAKAAVLVNLLAVIEGTKLGMEIMQRLHPREGGCIVNVASYAACVRVPFSAVYAATKSGVLHFSRSLKYLASENIRVAALCPSFADTPMVRLSMGMPAQAAEGIATGESVSSAVAALGTLMTARHVAKQMLRLIKDPELAGEGLVVTPRGTYQYAAGRRPGPASRAREGGTSSASMAGPLSSKDSVEHLHVLLSHSPDMPDRTSTSSSASGGHLKSLTGSLSGSGPLDVRWASSLRTIANL